MGAETAVTLRAWTSSQLTRVFGYPGLVKSQESECLWVREEFFPLRARPQRLIRTLAVKNVWRWAIGPTSAKGFQDSKAEENRARGSEEECYWQHDDPNDLFSWRRRGPFANCFRELGKK